MKAFLLPALLVSSAMAAELTIKTSAAESTLSVDATFIPTTATVIKIEPKQWKSFIIADLVDHGTVVKQGDPLITFENEDFQRSLAESMESAKSRTLALAQAERELADLKISTPHTLEGLKLAHDRAKEELDDFITIGLALSKEEAKERLNSSKRSLSYIEEELKQLLKMYKEDGITEETEEIILTRQRAAVKAARFQLKKAEKNTAWALEKTIPRKAVDLKRNYDDAQLAYKTGKTELPRTLKEKILALAKTKRDHAEDNRKLAELQADATFFTLLAPTDGVIYYGEINDHSWSTGDTSKFLKKSGSAPAKTPLMTLIPSNTPLALHGMIEQADRLNISAGARGSAEVAGLKNSTYPIAITSLAGAPDRSDHYRISLSIKLPADSPIVTGMKAKVKLLTYQNEGAINIPSAAITTKNGVSTVKLKMADGKDKIREVKLGRVLDNGTEILKGLEVDQVIVIPDPEK